MGADQWRLRRVVVAEVGMIRVNHRDTERNLNAFASMGTVQTFTGYAMRDMLPSEGDCKHLLRYETTFERQLYRSLDQLERMQRARKGEMVPAPINVNVIAEKE